MNPSTHRSSQIRVDLTAIQKNYQAVMDHLPPKTQGIAVVKADAYGHGSVPVARVLENQVQAFAVATGDEALELREAGIVAPIFVMGPTNPKDALLYSDQQIGISLLNEDFFQELLNVIEGHSLNYPLAVHLKVDTGMGRVGVQKLEDCQSIIDHLADHQDHLCLKSIFTHMATADSMDPDQVAQVEDQYKTFIQAKENLDLSKLDQPVLWHCSNSAMSLWQVNKTLDAVRIGVALYGINPSNGSVDLPVDLIPALSLTTQIAQVKQMEAGQKLSYGATYTCQDGEWIASLPIGYADGWIRAYQGFQVLVDGRPCELVGRVCMDQCLIRLPSYYPVGQKVTLVGQDGGERISLEALSQHVGTIAYESACLLSDRLPKYYMGEKDKG